MPSSNRQPKHWTVDELFKSRAVAERLFRDNRNIEGQAAYQLAFDEVCGLIEAALEVTDNLNHIDAALLAAHNQLWRTLRYFCAPLVSEEDYWTLVGKKFTRVPAEFAEVAADVINKLLDKRRLPWIADKRKPTRAEKSAAILATATLLTHEKHKTERRGLSAKTQEEEVAVTLKAAGLSALLTEDRRHIATVDDLPRGSFCKEQKILTMKCDVPCRLFDGRIFALECKVSNGPKNGWKRLLREVGGKADTWRQTFGDKLITGAVIAGVFDLKCLERAQNEHLIAIFWQHDLAPLRYFIESTKTQ